MRRARIDRCRPFLSVRAAANRCDMNAVSAASGPAIAVRRRACARRRPDPVDRRAPDARA
ncbi:hypothetical protein WS83_25105 [Burkholderia sp. MSMB2042]|uniref:Uncharacterized protein n=1 Tax=Burkholderia savannae TaxID=1637837 RepID=A0ABR5T276_9BURK|nr:hypothetical protein WS78_29090 [Burkholderia savannae]KVG45034.1 hypothetical protein WS77_07660 [Burkholderia sp. MSMB0265]KVG96161.1 hypothetical protein WS82_03070 [Burkholderia sp. MSMB2041]KVG99791.1 hypothetical protein WS83_25105 [Burkholderia sp. MSMB2042]KWZ37333.1 hypothetical protein WS72_20275 [Burkholderia savannae]